MKVQEQAAEESETRRGGRDLVEGIRTQVSMVPQLAISAS